MGDITVALSSNSNIDFHEVQCAQLHILSKIFEKLTSPGLIITHKTCKKQSAKGSYSCFYENMDEPLKGILHIMDKKMEEIQ